MQSHHSYELFADISSNNKNVSIPYYSRAGHVLVAIKATQGETYKNPFHVRWSEEAHEFGLTVMHYHFCENGNTDLEIQNFREEYNLRWRSGDYSCFDIEENQGMGYAKEIIGNYHSKTHREPVLYCDSNDYNNKYRFVNVPGERFWIANYSEIPVKAWARQYTNGEQGPEPHYYSGIGKSDGSVLRRGPAMALSLRKIRTRKRK